MEGKGLIQLYLGDGKGKTTAAVGQAVRMAGWGRKILFAQFLKNAECGERLILQNLEGVRFIRPVMRHKGFIWDMDDKALKETGEDLQNGFLSICSEITAGHFDLAVLDEVLDILDCGFISENQMLELLLQKPAETELVMTGRRASDKVKEKAHYISIVTNEKHPYATGITARKGIEY